MLSEQQIWESGIAFLCKMPEYCTSGGAEVNFCVCLYCLFFTNQITTIGKRTAALFFSFIKLMREGNILH